MKNNLLILERSTFKMASSKSNGEYILEGVFSEIGVRNNNNRIYDENELVPHIEEMAAKVADKKILGELDHPNKFEVSLKNASHVIEEINYDKTTKQVTGKIRLLDTDAGRNAKALVDAGIPIHISSRAAGVVEKNGHVKIKKLFTYDLVADPGFKNAQLHRINESFGLDEDSNIQIFDINKMPQESTEKTDTVNESKDESFVSLKDFKEYTSHIKSVFEGFKTSISEIKESQNTFEGKDLKEYLDTLTEKVNLFETTVNNITEDQSNIIAHSDYLTESLESVKDYAEMIALKTDQGIEYTKSIREGVVTEFESQHDINEANTQKLESVIEYTNYLVEQTENVANYSEMIKEALESVGTTTESLQEKISVIEEGTSKSSVPSKTVNENKQIINEEKSSEEFFSKLDESINALIESAKKQKAVEESNKDFSNLLTDDQMEIFTKLDESKKDQLSNLFESSTWETSTDVNKIWESFFITETPKLDWLSNMPVKYKEIYESLSKEKKDQIAAQASIRKFSDQNSINEFWNSRDLREVKVNLNESSILNNDSGAQSNSYMDVVTKAFNHRFRFNNSN